jgi:hypothetical protein
MAKSRKVVPLERALEIVERIPKEFGLKEKQEVLLRAVILACPPVEDAGVSYIDLSHLKNFCNNYLKSIREKDLTFMCQEKGYRVQPVDPEEFFMSPKFMDQKPYMRPLVKKELLRFLDNRDQYVEVALGGAIGIGKSYWAEMCLDYFTYDLSCLISPQAEFDLAPGSPLIIILQSVSTKVVERAIYEPMRARLSMSPYFQEHFPFDQKTKSKLVFPKQIQIIPISSSALAAIAINVYGGLMTEVAYMPVIENSKLGEERTGSIYDMADVNYTTISQRMKSRFQDKGKNPCVLILDSATKYPGDFMDRKFEEAVTDPSIFTMRYAQWDTIPAEKFTGEKFLVEVGDSDRPSRIIADMRMAIEGAEVLEVPVEYQRDFRRNCELALRDFAGRTVVAEAAWMSDRAKIAAAIQRHQEAFNGQTLFREESIVIDEYFNPVMPDWEKIWNEEYIKEPSFDNTAIFNVHLDLGTSHDSVGLCISHVFGYVDTDATSYYSEKRGEFVELTGLSSPVVCLDAILQIRPPYGGQINHAMVRAFAFWLCRKLNIKFGTMDTFEKTSLMQGFKALKVRSGIVSTEKTLVPYTEWKYAYVEDRMMHPPQSVYQKEISDLLYFAKEKKVHHKPGSHNDTTDAAAACTHILIHKIAKYSRTKAVAEAAQAQERQNMRKLMVGGTNKIRVS